MSVEFTGQSFFQPVGRPIAVPVVLMRGPVAMIDEVGPGMIDRKCARCGKTLAGVYATVWRGGVTGYYCHDDNGSCYVSATRDGYPELGVTDEHA